MGRLWWPLRNVNKISPTITNNARFKANNFVSKAQKQQSTFA